MQGTAQATSARLVVIGGGVMGGVLAAAAIRGGHVGPDHILVCEPDRARRERLRATGVAVADGAAALPRVAADAQVLLAVKPQMFAAAAREYASLFQVGAGQRRVVLSIMAGVATATIEAAIGSGVAVVRAMPTVTVQTGLGVAAVCLGKSAGPSDATLLRAILESCCRGPSSVVDIGESLMDAFTALAGSGPAYVFLLAEAMVKAGVEAGFDPRTADVVVRGVVEGAGAMLGQGQESPASLRQSVTSKGGTTEAALKVLADRGLVDALVAAIKAGRDRGRELGRQAGGPA